LSCQAQEYICNHKERQAQECKRPDSCGASPSHFPLRKNPNPGFELLHFLLLLLPHGLEFQLTNIISIELGANKISKDMMSSKDYCKLLQDSTNQTKITTAISWTSLFIFFFFGIS
jgi:hypothetical protein